MSTPNVALKIWQSTNASIERISTAHTRRYYIIITSVIRSLDLHAGPVLTKRRSASPGPSLSSSSPPTDALLGVHENDWEGVDNLDPIPLSTQSSAPLVTKLEAFASGQNLPEAREGTSCILNDYWQYL